MHGGGQHDADRCRPAAEALTAAMAAMPAVGAAAAAAGRWRTACAVAAGLGARVAFMGKVADDALGEAFRRRNRRRRGCILSDARCWRDRRRPRCCLDPGDAGCAAHHEHVSRRLRQRSTPRPIWTARLIADIRRSSYLEGYLFDPPSAQAGVPYRRRDDRAGGGPPKGGAVAVGSHFASTGTGQAFHALLPRVDILFANETEICSPLRVGLRTAWQDSRRTGAPRRRARRADAQRRRQPDRRRGDMRPPWWPAAASHSWWIRPGAGDCYAAGFLAAFAAGRAACRSAGTLGSLAAAAVHCGVWGQARPAASEMARSCAST